MNRSILFFNSLNSLIYSGGTGINPLTLNPVLYYQSFDTSFLNPSSPSIGDSILDIYKYDDSSQLASGFTDCVPTYESLGGKNMLYFPGIQAGCWPPPCTGGTCTTSYYASDDLNFMHLSGYSYTIYLVTKPLSGGTRGYVFSDRGDGFESNKGIFIGDSFDNYNTFFTVEAASTPSLPSATNMITLPLEFNGNESTLENKGLRIFSIRASDPLNTTFTAVTSYVNGIEVTAVTQNFVSCSSDISGQLHIGSIRDNIIGDSTKPYKGYFGELIIFNTIHDIPTHNSVIDFLKNRWNIT